MRTIILLLLLFPQLALAQEQWLCTMESSQRRGDSIYACGIGFGAEESQARAAAFKDAKDEFQRLCETSDCKRYSIDPKRTTCEDTVSGWKCYRLLVYVPQGPEELKKSIASNNPFDLFLHRKGDQ